MFLLLSLFNSIFSNRIGGVFSNLYLFGLSEVQTGPVDDKVVIITFRADPADCFVMSCASIYISCEFLVTIVNRGFVSALFGSQL